MLSRLDKVAVHTGSYVTFDRLMLLHAIRQGNSEKCPMLSTVRIAGDLILTGMGITKVSPHTQDWAWKTMCASLVGGSTWDSIIGRSLKVHLGPMETKVSYAIAIQAAAYEGNVALLETLLDQQPDACSVCTTLVGPDAFKGDALDMVELDHPIFAAARRANLGAVKVLAGRHSGTNFDDVFDRNENTALHFAAASGCLPLFDFCTHHIRISGTSRNVIGMTPLRLAAFLGRMDIVEAVCRRNNDAYMKLIWCEGLSRDRYSRIEFRLRDEIDCMEIGAAECGQTAALKCIFTHAKDIAEKLTHDDAVSAAIRSGQIDAVRIIMDYCSTLRTDVFEGTAWEGLCESVEHENTQALEYFLRIDSNLWELGAGKNNEALLLLFNDGSEERIRHVVNHPALKDSDMLQEALEPLTCRSSRDLLELLLAKPQVNINRRYFGNETILSFAKREAPEMVEFLISKGAHK